MACAPARRPSSRQNHCCRFHPPVPLGKFLSKTEHISYASRHASCRPSKSSISSSLRSASFLWSYRHREWISHNNRQFRTRSRAIHFHRCVRFQRGPMAARKRPGKSSRKAAPEIVWIDYVLPAVLLPNRARFSRSEEMMKKNTATQIHESATLNAGQG